MAIGVTDRIELRQWRPTDLAVFRRLMTDPKVVRFLNADGNAEPLEVVAELAKRSRVSQERGWGSWAIVDVQTKQVIGSCGFGEHTLPDPSIGWRILPERWGQGLATEAARVAIEVGFSKFKFPRILAICHRDNQASLRVMRKLGMKPIVSASDDGEDIVRYVIEHP